MLAAASSARATARGRARRTVLRRGAVWTVGLSACACLEAGMRKFNPLRLPPVLQIYSISMWRRVAVSLAIGISSGTLCWALMRNLSLGAGDFTPALREAHQMLAGGNPFIFAARHYPAYPLPAAILGLPFLWLKTEIAAGAFFGASSALLAFGLTREGYTRLLVFLAYPYWAAMLTVQWAPLLMASALLPWLLPVTTAKPQLGASIFLAYPTRRGIVGCILLLALSLILVPPWPRQWLASLGFYEH